MGESQCKDSGGEQVTQRDCCLQLRAYALRCSRNKLPQTRQPTRQPPSHHPQAKSSTSLLCFSPLRFIHPSILEHINSNTSTCIHFYFSVVDAVQPPHFPSNNIRSSVRSSVRSSSPTLVTSANSKQQTANSKVQSAKCKAAKCSDANERRTNKRTNERTTNERTNGGLSLSSLTHSLTHLHSHHAPFTHPLPQLCTQEYGYSRLRVTYSHRNDGDDNISLYRNAL